MSKKLQLHNSTENINFAIHKLDIKRFVLIEPDLEKFPGQEKLDIIGSFGINFKLNQNKNINLSLEFNINHLESDIEINLLNFNLIAEFSITDINLNLQSDDDIKRLPLGFLTQLASIAYSSARGIMFAKTQGSYLNRFLLPLIDMNQIVVHYLNNQNV